MALVPVLTAKCTEGSGVGFPNKPPVLRPEEEEWPGAEREWAVGEERRVEVAGEGEGEGGAVWLVRRLDGERLLLVPGPGALPDASREAFIRLLEWAEERVGASEVLLRIEKAVKDLPVILRTFAYFGFAVLPPTIALQFTDPARFILMSYTI